MDTNAQEFPQMAQGYNPVHLPTIVEHGTKGLIVNPHLMPMMRHTATDRRLRTNGEQS